MAKKKHFKRGNKSNANWANIVRENAKWEAYYRNLNLFNNDEAEWSLFKETCQKDLPLTFRITGTRKHANEILSIFKERHLASLSNVEFEGEIVKAPLQLPWYPDHLAWQLDVPKKVIRKNEQFAKTQRFLVSETATGNISRQEAVSMIPPLLLRVKPNHTVLDMCAAPGSKTAQLIEQLHKDTDEPSGFIIANDSDMRRSHMLVHQLKRLNSSNYLVLNHDAQFFPRIQLDKLDSKKVLKFDRILCDVPCSGDATMRKNINVWKEWKYQNALGLHALQYNILNRGLQLLEDGGRLVYSTCSINPIENEAVISQALRQWGDKIRLIDCSDELPGLIRSSGLSKWSVIDRNGEEKNVDDENTIRSWFAPSDDEIIGFNLDRCIRVYPHQQNTGGFFIAVIEKDATVSKTTQNTTVDLPEKESIKKSLATKQKEKKIALPLDAIDEPFVFIDENHDVLNQCWKFYGIDDQYDKTSCLVRSATGEPTRVIYKVLPPIKNIIQLNEEKLKIIYSGIKLFVYQRSDIECAWRIHREALPSIKHHMKSNRIIETSLNILRILLTEPFPTLEYIREQDGDEEFIEVAKKTASGCAFVHVQRNEKEQESLLIPIWVGVNSVNIMIAKEDVHELLYRIFNIETIVVNKQARVSQEETEKTL